MESFVYHFSLAATNYFDDIKINFNGDIVIAFRRRLSINSSI